ncbi:MAG TPA: fumarylacetoacetate hydrolase family protein, partial [Myxococcales bacterium]
MARSVIPSWDLPALPVSGTDALFPVRRIHCVGRNYAEHSREMGGDPDREPPFFFNKPADAIVPNGGDIPYPPQTQKLAYEMELVVAIGKGGVNVPRESALEHVFGYAVGLDLTRRDLQAAAKEKGRPWEPGKAFDKSAPVS